MLYLFVQFVKVMPSGGQCYEVGPFFPTIPHHVTRMGISRKRNLLLHPDWLVIWGLLAGAVLMLGMCVTLLVSGYSHTVTAVTQFLLIRHYC